MVINVGVDAEHSADADAGITWHVLLSKLDRGIGMHCSFSALGWWADSGGR